MKKLLVKILNVEEDELIEVLLLLLQGFLMGVFLSTYNVGAQTLFLDNFDEKRDLPIAMIITGVIGIVLTFSFSWLQNRVSFPLLSLTVMVSIVITIAALRYGFGTIDANTMKNNKNLIFLAFVLAKPFEALVSLIFWGTLARMFAIKQQKRILGSIDVGKALASLIAYFAIPVILVVLPNVVDLLYLSFVSAIVFCVVLIIMVFSSKNLSFFTYRKGDETYEKQNQTASLQAFFGNAYILFLIGLTFFAVMSSAFLDYSFLNTTAAQYPNEKDLGSFLGVFGGFTIIFAIISQLFIADRITEMYGLRLTLLINPSLLLFFTLMAVLAGSFLGYTPASSTFIFFFLSMALAKLFADAFKDAFDEPTMKLFFLPIESRIRLDVSAKLDGVVKVMAGTVAGITLTLIDNSQIFNLLSFSFFLLPIIIGWIFFVNQVHGKYKTTLQKTLQNTKKQQVSYVQETFGVDRILLNALKQSQATEQKILLLKIMQHIEPSIFETKLREWQNTSEHSLAQFIATKESELDSLQSGIKIFGVASNGKAVSIATAELAALQRSKIAIDRIKVARLLRQQLREDTLPILLQLLRDPDPQVKWAALLTCRKVNRPEIWSYLIDLLDDAFFAQIAKATLIDAGEAVLPVLENAFHKTGQSLEVMIKIIQIYKRLGTSEAIDLIWKKIDHPSKEVIEEALLAFSYCNVSIPEERITNINYILDVEMSDAAWDVAAMTEIPEYDFTQPLRESLQEEITYNFDNVFNLLGVIYDPQSIQLVRENLESGSSEGKLFAIELLDIFVEDKLKKKLFPLIDELDLTKKNDALQIYFPREDLNEVDVLKHLIMRDYNYTNTWTRACAMYALGKMEEIGGLDELIANLFHPDPLLMEMSAWALYFKNEKLLLNLCQRLDAKAVAYILNTVIPACQQRGGFMPLRFDRIMFLRKASLLKNVQGDIMAQLIEMIQVETYKAGDAIVWSTQDSLVPLCFIASGQVQVKDNRSEERR
ncbi:MAG TPA: hypothetical protein DCM08_05495, partial [Microscillaceae bacterium]|nr:hypothetical protein [Microscillaceae bacterium]